MNKIKSILVLGALSFTLISCNNNASSITNADQTTADNPLTPTYTLKDVNIYRVKNKVDKQMKIRFYKDTPNVPYVGIKEYFKEFYNTDLAVKNENGFNIFSKDNKEYIKLNSAYNIFEIKDLFNLGHHPDFIENKNKTFINVDSTKNSKSYFKVIDLSKYEIKTYDDNGESYVPLGLLNNLYGGIEGYNVAYNQHDIYVMDAFGSLTGEDRNDEYFSDTYYEYITKDEARPEDLVKYNYNQLCFTIDNLRGYTSQLMFGDNNLLTLGLNGVLEEYYPGIKRMLLSTKKSDYEKGFILLMGGLFDGGHTGLISRNPPNLSYIPELQNNDEFKEFTNKFMAEADKKTNKQNILNKAKGDSFGSEYVGGRSFYYNFNKETSTAYIGFDKFVYNTVKWDKYYKGDTNVLNELEDPFTTDDTYAFVRKSLYSALNDEAKNVVLDVATNGGGSVEAIEGVFGLFNKGKAYFISNDTVSTSRETKNYSIDVNLDGKYDDADAKELEKFNFNYVVLSSSFTFSSANLFASQMKENGFKTVGEKSGGGSCAVIREETADGFLYSRSSYLCLSNLKGDNIDSGVDVDYYLVDTVNNEPNYSKFYNFKVMADYIATFAK